MRPQNRRQRQRQPDFVRTQQSQINTTASTPIQNDQPITWNIDGVRPDSAGPIMKCQVTRTAPAKSASRTSQIDMRIPAKLEFRRTTGKPTHARQLFFLLCHRRSRPSPGYGRQFRNRHILLWQAYQPTLPSSEMPISFCVSAMNSIGSCWRTSRTKPLTTSATASSSSSPRWRQ